MASIKFFGKPGCVNNEKQKKLLIDAGHKVDFINILEFPWTTDNLRSFFGKSQVKNWFNPSAPAITRGGIKPEKCSEDTALQEMIDDRLLIKRPLMEINNERFCGFSATDLEMRIGNVIKTAAEQGISLDDDKMSICPFSDSNNSCTTQLANPEAAWSIWLREGKQYLKAGSGKNNKFNNEILYNLLAMSLEKLVMAILGFKMSLPFNHTFTDLMEALEKIVPIEKEFKDTILSLEKKQELCSFDEYIRTDISNEDIVSLRAAVIKIMEMAEGICLKERAPVIISA